MSCSQPSAVVAVIAAHPSASRSMNRYSSLLSDAYQQTSHVKVLRPKTRFNRQLRFIRKEKYGTYLDQLLFFLRLAVFHRSTFSLVHFADHSDALGILIFRPMCPVVVTCHDLFAVMAQRGAIPEYSPGLSGSIYQKLVVRGLRLAHRVECVSEETRNDVRRILNPGYRGEIGLLPNPLDPALVDGRRMNLTRTSTALIVGGADWRKRRQLSIEAWLSLTTVWPDLELIVIGPPLTESEQSQVSSYPMSPPIHQIESVTDEELAYYYSTCRTLIQMSKYEGFCWPIAEANAFGMVCICSDIPILRETGPSNIFVSATELGEVDWFAVAAGLNDPRRREESTKLASRFSYELFCKRTQGIISSLERGGL